MAKIPRVFQRIFGSTAGANQIAQFGSLAAGAINYTTNVSTIQSLSNYVTGWFAAVVGANSPAIEDMNALFYVGTTQLAYLFQAGVSEWDASTTYYIGSVVNDGTGAMWVSLTDTNLNNALSTPANWTLARGLSTNLYPYDMTVITGTSRTYAVPTFTAAKTWTINSGGTLVTIGSVTFGTGFLVTNGDWIAL